MADRDTMPSVARKQPDAELPSRSQPVSLCPTIYLKVFTATLDHPRGSIRRASGFSQTGNPEVAADPLRTAS